MSFSEARERIEAKMRTAGIPPTAIAAFLNNFAKVAAGHSGWLPEASIEPVASLPRLEDLPPADPSAEPLLNQLALVRPNGGLGTSMGLDRPKSLMTVKGSDNFLDFIARQVLSLRARTGTAAPEFHLMNSQGTRRESLDYLRKYAELSPDGDLDFLQYPAPKLLADTLEPVSWPHDPEWEWCPQGHGDLYPSMRGCGLIRRMLDRGIRFLFLANVDNLGATVDSRILKYFAESGAAFLMEVAERTPTDNKGGHLARRRDSGRLLLREVAQCPPEETGRFQDVNRHRFFNTNNLWIRLDRLEAELERHGGMVPLPLIQNRKTVDPRDPGSPQVLQLETAMGAAIEHFADAGALVVPRSRFAPVKTTADLLALRSDAYQVTDDHRLVLAPTRDGRPPLVELDPRHYRVMAAFEAKFSRGIPSLIGCETLKVQGALTFAPGVVCRGKVELVARGEADTVVPPGVYRDGRYEFP